MSGKIHMNSKWEVLHWMIDCNGKGFSNLLKLKLLRDWKHERVDFKLSQVKTLFCCQTPKQQQLQGRFQKLEGVKGNDAMQYPN